MKIKSSVLFGLIVVIFSISGFSLLKRLTRDIDEWRPSDLYSTTNVTRRSTFSVVSSGASASYSGAAPSVSSGASSMFRHRSVSLYAPASGPAYSQLPLASSPLASSPQGGLYATSSAEFRSFGGGGNVGAVSMSGGSVKSSGSSVAPASGLSVSMPNASMYAFAGQGANNNIPVVSSDAAIASVASASSYTTAYSGIGRTATGGAFRGLGGRQNAAPTNNDYASWLRWLDMHGSEYADGYDDETGTYTYSEQAAWDAFCGWFSMAYPGSTPDDYTGADAAILWEQWLSWFKSNNGSHQGGDGWHNFVPVGDYLPLLFMALFYVAYIFIRRREVKNL